VESARRQNTNGFGKTLLDFYNSGFTRSDHRLAVVVLFDEANNAA